MDSTSSLAAEFSDPERITLIERLHKWNDCHMVAVEAWACLWFSDLAKLRYLVDHIDDDVAHSAAVQYILKKGCLATELVQPWVNKDRSTSTASTPRGPSSPVEPITPTRRPSGSTAESPRTPYGEQAPSLDVAKDSRDQALRSKTMQRDERCVITKAGRYLESAHIYSFSMRKHLVPRALLWNTLRMFWPDQDVEAWQQRLFTPAKTETLENRIAMAKTVQSAWDHCEFAFRPIQTAEDKTSMVAQFFWLKYRDYGRGLVSLLETPDLPSDYPSGRGDLKFWDCLSEKKVVSGDTIVLRTHDPVNFPLPSEELLWMQWHLNRVAALSGASETLDPFHIDEDDENNDAIMVDYDSERGSPFGYMDASNDDSKRDYANSTCYGLCPSLRTVT